VRNRKIIEVKD